MLSRNAIEYNSGWKTNEYLHAKDRRHHPGRKANRAEMGATPKPPSDCPRCQPPCLRRASAFVKSLIIEREVVAEKRGK